ncbi:MAG: peptidoglycan-binding domain-containing protein [Pseudomonadales bacterium]
MVLSSTAFFGTLAHAADEEGRYSVRGAGLLSCEAFTKERAGATPAYQMIGGWLDGYITALNANRAQTYDITSYESTEILASILDRHCQSHPKQRLFSVVNAVTSQLHAQRISAASPRQRVVIGERSTELYNETVTRLQLALVEQGLLLHDAVSGHFDKPTATAVASYQQQLEFEPTGFPDQATLWILFTATVPG